MKKTVLILLIIFPIIGILYFSGPRLNRPIYNVVLPQVPPTSELDDFVSINEANHKIKPGNEAKIIWNNEVGKISDFAIVYLHGFSASHEEGNPLHLQTAKQLNANLFLPRLADHGLDTVETMLNFTPERLWESAKLALAVGKNLGKKVILMGTSTGGSLALQLAAKFPNDVHSIILISPNIEINDKFAFLLNDPWGLEMARWVIGGKERKIADKSDEYKKYWYTNYRLESVVALEEYIETTMHSKTFNSVKQPVLLLYYYKNEQEQDPVVRVKPMLDMFNGLGTPANFKFKFAIPNSGNHVIGSKITSGDINTPQVYINKFVEFIKK